VTLEAIEPREKYDAALVVLRWGLKQTPRQRDRRIQDGMEALPVTGL